MTNSLADQNIKAKIKKLFALAADKGASEDEAATALRMAAGLMLKHNIQQSELGEVPKVKKQYLNATFHKHQIVLANAAAHLFGCRVIFYQMGKKGLEFVGRPDNIELAQETMLWLTQQLETFYKQQLPRGLTQRDRSEFRKTFKWACATRVEERVVMMVHRMKHSDQAAQETTGSTALVVKSQYDQMLGEADTLMKDVPEKRISGAYGSGSDQGRIAGDRVQIRKEVGHERKQIGEV